MTALGTFASTEPCLRYAAVISIPEDEDVTRGECDTPSVQESARRSMIKVQFVGERGWERVGDEGKM